MKASVHTRYGSPAVLEIRQLPKPAPKTNEVLIRVHATTVNRTDCGMLRAHPFFIRLSTGLFRPKLNILGMDFAGVIEAVGSRVVSFKTGDRVFGMSPYTFGAHAEYLCVPENGQIAEMPTGLGFDQAVICEGAWYADTCLKAVGLMPGDDILIYGASGAIGVAAVQLAKAYGARVTAVVATKHLDLVTSLGADRVIDYTAEDFTQINETFDCVLDAVGKTTFLRCRKRLKPGGRFATTDLGPWWQSILLASWFPITGSKRVLIPFPKPQKGFVDHLRALLEASKFRAVIDRTYPLVAIGDAYRYVERGQKTGIVVIDVARSSFSERPAGPMESPSVGAS